MNIDFMILAKIYFAGLTVLMGAVAINIAAKFAKLPSWYEFLSKPRFTLTYAFWLFVLYPFALGLLVYLSIGIFI